jgi:hypothetical protein
MGGVDNFNQQPSWGTDMGSMGNNSQGVQGNIDDGWAANQSSGDDDDDTPLLQELEIYPEHIREKTLEVLNPVRPIKDEYLQDADLAGPLLFCLVLGVCLLFVSAQSPAALHAIVTFCAT